MATFKSIGQLVRQFSTSSVQQKLVATPIQVYGVEGRYASALYSAAVKEKQLDAVEKDLKTFKGWLKTDSQLSAYLSNPTLKKAEKTSVIQDILKKHKFNNLTCNVFGAMAENGRLNKSDGIITTFQKVMSAHRGEIVCVVTTAKALDSKNQKDLEAALSGFVKPGQSLLLELKVDPAIIGGMVVNLGDDRFVDMSMSSKIKMYTKLIEDAV